MFLIKLRNTYSKKKVNCEPLFNNPNIDNPSKFEEPPQRIPKWLIPEYNYGGKVPISHQYRDDTKGAEKKGDVYWPTEKLEKMEKAIQNNNTFKWDDTYQKVLDIGTSII